MWQTSCYMEMKSESGLMPDTQAHKTERTLSPIIVNGLLPCGPASARSFRQKTLKKQNTLRPVCAPRLSMRSSTHHYSENEYMQLDIGHFFNGVAYLVVSSVNPESKSCDVV